MILDINQETFDGRLQKYKPITGLGRKNLRKEGVSPPKILGRLVESGESFLNLEAGKFHKEGRDLWAEIIDGKTKL